MACCCAVCKWYALLLCVVLPCVIVTDVTCLDVPGTVSQNLVIPTKKKKNCLVHYSFSCQGVFFFSICWLLSLVPHDCRLPVTVYLSSLVMYFPQLSPPLCFYYVVSVVDFSSSPHPKRPSPRDPHHCYFKKDYLQIF